LYTRWPKPMIRSLRANRSRISSPTRSALPMSIRSFITCSLAPPCSGPLSAPMAPVIAECMSESVEAITRAVNVEAFISWSACRMRATSKVLAAAGEGFSPVSMWRKLAAWPSAGSGGIGSPPARVARDHRRHLGDEAHRLAAVGVGVVRVLVGIVEAVRRHGRAQHLHRGGVAGQHVDDLGGLLRELAVVGEVGQERVELLLRR